jgi:hypothetical protein
MTETLKGVTEDCLVFYDLERKVGVNVIPLKDFDFLPRVDDVVYLPGTVGKGGLYKIDSIEHHYRDLHTDRGDVALMNITARVKAVRPSP